MAKYARLNSAGLVMETCDGDPTTRFVESIASQFVEVDDNAATGDTVTDGTLVKYVAPEVTLLLRQLSLAWLLAPRSLMR